MSKRGGGKRPGGKTEPDSTVDRVMTALERWPDGMHDLGRLPESRNEVRTDFSRGRPIDIQERRNEAVQ